MISLINLAHVYELLMANELLTDSTVTMVQSCIVNIRPTRFYRAMHFSAKRGIAIACRLSVRPSVCDVGEL